MSSNDEPPSGNLGRRKPARQWDEKSLDNAAQHYLARYASSAGNLRRVLRRRCEDKALVDLVVERCRTRGFVDDAAYAAARAASLRRAGRSRRAIEERLKEKGVDRETISGALSAGPGEIEAAVALARRRRLGPWRRDDSRPAFRDKDMAAMARAGFPLEIVRQVLACRSPEEAEALTRS